MSTENVEVQQEETVTMVSYYTYKSNGVALLFDEEVSVIEGSPQPDNSSKWKPKYDPETQDAYWDGIGWVVGRKFDSLTEDEIKASALKVLQMNFSDSVSVLNADYPDAETSTWPRQEADARSYVATKVATPFLQTLAITRGSDVDSLAESIVAKADAYYVKYAELLGAYQSSVASVSGKQITPDMLRLTLLVRGSA